jgi:hypothetical protein
MYMKKFLKGVMLMLVLGGAFLIASALMANAESPAPEATPVLTMSASQWAAYKAAREAKDWAACEELTVYPDVKAWDAQNQGQAKFVLTDYTGARTDFDRALTYADQAEALGRTKTMERLRAMVGKALKSIDEVESLNKARAAKKAAKPVRMDKKKSTIGKAPGDAGSNSDTAKK